VWDASLFEQQAAKPKADHSIASAAHLSPTARHNPRVVTCPIRQVVRRCLLLVRKTQASRVADARTGRRVFLLGFADEFRKRRAQTDA
jgi:hypothetical protein